MDVGGREIAADAVGHIRIRPGKTARKRTLAERLFVRFPNAAPAAIRRVSRLSPHNRFRRAIAARACAMGWEASSRGDFEMLAVTYHPEAEYTTAMPAALRYPDSPPDGTFRGRAAIREYIERFHDSWSAAHFKLTDVLLLPDDERGEYDHVVLTAGVLYTRGRLSGIETAMPFSVILHLKDGWLFRQYDYWDYGDALRAVGLDPAAFPDLGEADRR